MSANAHVTLFRQFIWVRRVEVTLYVFTWSMWVEMAMYLHIIIIFARDAALEVEINMVFPSVVAQRPPRGKIAEGWQIYI